MEGKLYEKKVKCRVDMESDRLSKKGEKECDRIKMNLERKGSEDLKMNLKDCEES
jgi:hypothetical protein